MVFALPQGPSPGQTIGQGVAGALGTLSDQLGSFQENKKIKDVLGQIDKTTDPTEALKLIYGANVSNQLKAQLASSFGDYFKQQAAEKIEQQKIYRDLYKENLQREKLVNTGNLLEKYFSGLNENSSLEDIQSAYVNVIKEGGDPDVIKTVLSQFQPTLKARAESNQASQAISDILGKKSQPINQQITPLPKTPEKTTVDEVTQQTVESLPSRGSEILPGDSPSDFIEQVNQDNISDDQIIALRGSPNKLVKNMGDALFDFKKFNQDNYNNIRKYETDLAKPFLTNLDNSRDSIRTKTNALADIDYAFEANDFGMFSKDQLADTLGKWGQGLVTPEGALARTALKEFLIGNIGRVGARPNQWIEQQISNMLTNFGRTPEANAMTRLALRNELAYEKEKIKIADKLIGEDRRKLGFVKADIASRVDKELEKFGEKQQKKLSYEIRQIYEKNKSKNDLLRETNKKPLRGTPLTPKMAKVFIERFGDKERALENAKKLGYEIYDAEFIKDIINEQKDRF